MTAFSPPSRFAAGLRASTVGTDRADVDRWLAALPSVVEHLLSTWSLGRDGPAWHGLTAVVLPVRGRDGAPAALKVGWPHPESREEPAALRRWGGRGAVALLASSEEPAGLLLERLHGDRTLEQLADDEEATAVLGRLARRMAVPAPDGFPAGSARAARWVEELPREWDALAASSGPDGLDRRHLDAAVETCRVEAADTGPRYLVHTDLHYGNVLAADREPWLAIDPKPVAGPLECGVTPPLWNRWPDLCSSDGHEAHVRHRLAVLVASARLDPVRAARWAHAVGVDTYLWSRRRNLDAAELATIVTATQPLLG